jgi:GT2 family glycosyltransferase
LSWRKHNRDEEVLEKLSEYMVANPDVGIVMPKVLYPDGRIQYLSKLLPSPFDLFGRRFLNFSAMSKFIDKRNEVYELKFTEYDKIMNIPNLSGCFMFLKTEVVKDVGLFDERFFMYLEDTDLSRRIHIKYKTIYYPVVSIYHEYNKESYKSKKILIYHIKSAIKYFDKWGWFSDKDRSKINTDTLNKLGFNK